MDSEFLYVHSCDLEENVQLRIGSLEGSMALLDKSHRVVGGNFFVTASVILVRCYFWSNYEAWNKIELSLDSFIHACLWDVSETLEPRFIAHSSVSLFSKRGVFRSGTIALKMEVATKPDDFLRPPLPSKHPSTLYGLSFNDIDNFIEQILCVLREFFAFTKHTGVDRLQKLTKEYGEKLIEHVDWLDRLTFPRIEQIKKEREIEQRCLYLIIEMVRVVYGDSTYSIVYYEKEDEIEARIFHSSIDPEIDMENICELKHHMMTRTSRVGVIERELKPNASARDLLEKIIHLPPMHTINTEERDLIWKFRYYLRNNRKALLKFVRAVAWNKHEEAAYALILVKEWSPLEASDALELLSPTFRNIELRRYAVSRLSHAKPEQILLYLPQLVQALKYERFIMNASKELQEQKESHRRIDGSKGEKGVSITENDQEMKHQQTVEQAMQKCLTGDDLTSFLIRSACSNPSITYYLYWYLKVEIEATAEVNAVISRMYGYVLSLLLSSLRSGGSDLRRRAASLDQQEILIEILVSMAKLVSQESGGRSQKEKALRRALREQHDLLNLCGLPLPLDPTIRVNALLPDVATLFNSNLMPMKLTFRTETNENYVTIFKRGDDLRQDQLIIQMIRLMDDILRADGLDLRLTPYSVLATSTSEGFVQFIKAIPLREVISNWGTVQECLRSFRPFPNGPFGIETEVIENYVRSCAGYSVICYILGIGDRHLHNLLLCENGKMFHVDFGYILGRDPKPFAPPPMKLTSEMINGMGGLHSKEWKEFRGFCFSAFRILRRHANVVLNLFLLMLDSGIPDIAIEKEKAVQKIEHRFHLDLTDELAEQKIEHLIDESVNAKITKLTDMVHDVHQLITN
uniref:Phosphatidylinositol 3-kinase catalytic subunit type 3 n=1 Tax=Setaria digitata TaxID=48799 RepID=A0A915PPY9_9BILA